MKVQRAVCGVFALSFAPSRRPPLPTLSERIQLALERCPQRCAAIRRRHCCGSWCPAGASLQQFAAPASTMVACWLPAGLHALRTRYFQHRVSLRARSHTEALWWRSGALRPLGNSRLRLISALLALRDRHENRAAHRRSFSDLCSESSSGVALPPSALPHISSLTVVASA